MSDNFFTMMGRIAAQGRIVAVCVTALLSGCLWGVIQDQRGRPVKGAAVSYTDSTGKVGAVSSLENGAYVFPGEESPASGEVQFTVEAPGCQTLQGQARSVQYETVETGNPQFPAITWGRLDFELQCESSCPDGGPQFDSTFDLIQEAIFENKGCTQSACHGESAQAGLDLRRGVSYANLVKVPSTEVDMLRVEPGDQERSYLWLKLAAKTFGETDEIFGDAMPAGGLPALSKNELEAVRLWIKAGAPGNGAVTGTGDLLDACLPPAEPVEIPPLDPPPPDTGVQLHMPRWLLTSANEREVCFVTYYDISGQVPEKYRDPSGKMFRFHRQAVTQDPLSHHLIINYYAGSADIHHPVWGKFTCKGGSRAGEPCEPTDSASCGPEGLCGSEVRDAIACIGFGPPDLRSSMFPIGGTQETSSEIAFPHGVFAQIPMKGIIVWNSHAFNLFDQDAKVEAWANYYFAEQQTYPLRGIFDTSHIFAMHTPPFQKETVCADYTLPEGARLFYLSSHTHKRGKLFTVTAPDGTQIYENRVYNDPETEYYDPPLVFDSPNKAERTLRYCSTYDNGATDPSEVKRASTTPPNSFLRCQPIACAEGKVGTPCIGEGTDALCDTSPGAGDGMCDACTLVGGVSTEDEMFVLIGGFYIVP